MEHRKKSGISLYFMATLCALSPFVAHAVPVSRMRMVMGTLLQIEVTAENSDSANKAAESAFDEIEKWDRRLSNYKEDSEISRINREAYPEGTVSNDAMILFLLRGLHLSDRTQGAFDMTIEPLTRLWKLREGKILRRPTKREIENARKKVGYGNLEITPKTKRVRFLVPGMGIDTGGIGKGYALDRGLEKIKTFPVQSATLNFGGEILYWSKEPREKIVKIKNPLNPKRIWKNIFLKKEILTAAVSTSGNYEKFVTLTPAASTTTTPAKKLSHILNLQTGEPVENTIRSVTVISRSATEADALSTTIFAMGLEEGKRFSDTLKQNGVWILYELQSSELKSFQSKYLNQWQTKRQ